MRTRRLVFAALIAFGALPAACSSKSPPPPVTPVFEAGAPDAAVVDGGDGGDVSDAATPDASDVAINPMAVAAELMDSAIDLAIKTNGAKVAPGMQPEGPAGRATLTEGEHFVMLVTLQPNRCYSIVGFSPTGQVANLDVKLMAPPIFTIPAGQSAATDKNQPVVGKGKNALCPLLPIPIAYKVDATAKKGMGRIGLQLFSKAK